MPIVSEKVNPDLLKERANCTFNVEEFATWWCDGKGKLVDKRAVDQILIEDAKEDGDIPPSYMSHKELYEFSVQKSTRLFQKLRQRGPKIELKLGNYAESLDALRTNMSQMRGANTVAEGFPLAVHLAMFVPTIMSQGTLEQQKKWAEKALNMQIIGTYAQTELGHGTFLRGLETRADFDPRKNEFILSSPSLSSYKWWPGGLGHTVSHAIVIAQLYTRGVHRGLYPFMVQVRDLETYKPMPGVIIGEIGPKIGMKAVNNGYLGFKNVRIPLENMLMKNAQVKGGGVFTKSPASVLTYATMVFVRVTIVRSASSILASATTIATRYSAVRRQSPIDPNKPEPQIIDHVTQQLKLLPNIAKAVIFKIAADQVANIFDEVTAEIGRGKLDRLPEMHALTCGLKAVCSADSTAGVEVCRLSCGGHGYMTSSSFPYLYGVATAACTYEGENTVVLLQTARYLMKVWKLALDGKPLVPTVAYLARYTNKTPLSNKWDSSVSGIINGLECAAANRVRIAFENLEKRKAAGVTPEVASNLTGIELTQAATLHIRAYLVRIGYEELKRITANLSAPMAVVFNELMELFVVDTCFTCIDDLLRFSGLTNADAAELQLKLETLLTKLRVNAVGVVDGFDIPDVTLNSTLGAYDGNVYERIFADAKKSPLNQEPVNESFHKYLKPMMKSSL